MWPLTAGGQCRKISLSRLFCRNVSNAHSKPFDIVIVGGGIIGCATARELSLRNKTLKLAIVEKEKHLAGHQSGHNSGVIHAGIYYAPGSLKAKLCLQGSKLAYQYLEEKKIPYRKVGKLIVAVEQKEVSQLEILLRRAQTNCVEDVRWLEKDSIKKIEPNCEGLAAIWSPNTGIVDWKLVTQSYAQDFQRQSGLVFTGFTVDGFSLDDTRENVVMSCRSSGQKIKSRFVVTAAGLFSDRIAKLTGGSYSPKIVPFRGEYLLLKPNKSNLVKTNVYPVPDPAFPFLGVHFTPRMDGSVWLGPNAVLAFKREGYHMLDMDVKDMTEAFSHRGLRKLAFRHLQQGLGEFYRSLNMTAQVDLLRRYVPSLTVDDVIRGPSGVRAQALDDHGHLVDDFVFDSGKDDFSNKVLHVRNAPSPGATSSLAIAKMIVDKVNKCFPLDG
ncbi:L-2-hydroxyglutarate dehydrogenase, mitochondrial [Halotydeus destructor]|nr:L-2-hydroxyglutarate dehydrogenase, mitochondrial [Halotydeus destructor]